MYDRTVPTFKTHLGPFQQFTEVCLACGRNTYGTDECVLPGNDHPLFYRVRAYVSQLYDAGSDLRPVVDRIKEAHDRHRTRNSIELFSIELLALVTTGRLRYTDASGRGPHDGIEESILGLLREYSLPKGE